MSQEFIANIRGRQVNMSASKIILFLFAITISVEAFSLFKHKRRANNEEDELIDYLKNVYDKEASKIFNKKVIADWIFSTDINNKEKLEEQVKKTLETAQYNKETWEKHFKGLSPEQFKDPILKREIFFLSKLGTSALDEKKLNQLTNLESEMSNVYSKGKICPYNNQNCNISKGLPLSPEIENILESSTDYDELEYVWTKWREETGAKIRRDYKIYVDLSNEAARLNDYQDMGDMWRSNYESETFVQDMDNLWQEVEPLYNELHKYVLNKLRDRYPQLLENKDDLIPAHLLGNMWAQSWLALQNYVKPYPNASTYDVTKALVDQEYTVLKMFETANEFYKSLGLESSDMCYNVSLGAVIEKPKDREIVCHASAWDFYDGKDFRVKMCTKINFEDFVTIHHEMGHIQYYLLYKDQHIALRSGANPGFHEAVGDTIALSVSTPDHLQRIGLLNYTDSDEASLNALMDMALERVAFLPFGLLIDKWRWDVFSGNITENEWNARWWYYREKIQKIKAPNKRTELDFDPGAKYHVPANSQYIAYFVAHILQFQFHRALCIAAEEYNPEDPTSKPLHKCDIYKSKAAGDKLRAGLSLGASKHWSEALEAITGETKLSGSAILEYFKPLYDFLVEENGKVQAQGRIGENSIKAEYQENNLVPVIVAGTVSGLIILAVIVFIVVKRFK